jgi:hypothetical protein
VGFWKKRVSERTTSFRNRSSHNLVRCPGRFVAEAATWSAVVHLLAAFRITKAKDEAGKEIEVKEEFTSGVVWCVPVCLKDEG